MEGSIRGRKRKVRKLTANGSCFLCLQTFKSERETKEMKTNTANLRRLLRYLQISVNSENTSKIEAEMDVEVDLCESCGKLHDRLSKLFQGLEQIQMETKFYLDEVHHRISNSGNIPELVQSYSEEVINDLETLTLMDKLRKDIACKSLSKSFPKVNLTRATLPNVGVEVQNAPETDTFEVIHFDDPISPPQPDPLETEEDPLGPDSPRNPKTKKTPKKVVVTSSKIKKCKKDKDSKICRCTYDQCGFQSRYQNSVYAHYNRVHLKKAPQKPKTKEPRKPWPFKKTYRDIYWKENPETGLIHCTKCDKTCRHPEAVINHYKRIHLQKQIKCNVCNAEFTWQGTLNQHVKTCQDNLEKRLAKENQKSSFQFACLFCEKKFETREKLRLHEANVHPNNEPYSCEICGKKFKRLFTQQQHINVAHLGKRYTCQFCKKEYRSRDKYIIHRKSCTEIKAAPEGESSTPSIPAESEAPASTASEVQAHPNGVTEGVELPATYSKIKKYTLNRETKIFHCNHDQCDFKARHKTVAHAHYNSVHLKRRYKCKKCGKVFAFSCGLSRHKKICGVVKNKNSDPPVPVFCELCGKSFQTQEILNCHQILEHKEGVDPPSTSSKIIKYILNEETNMFQCSHDQCDFQSRHKPVVHAHYGSVHLKIKPKCEMCGKVFTFPCALSKHKRLYCRQMDHKDVAQLGINRFDN